MSLRNPWWLVIGGNSKCTWVIQSYCTKSKPQQSNMMPCNFLSQYKENIPLFVIIKGIQVRKPSKQNRPAIPFKTSWLKKNLWYPKKQICPPLPAYVIWTRWQSTKGLLFATLCSYVLKMGSVEFVCTIYHRGWESSSSHLAAAALIAAEEGGTAGPRGPFDPCKPGGIPPEGGRIEEPRGKPPLGSPGPLPCGEACIVKEWDGTSPLAVTLSHKSKGLPDPYCWLDIQFTHSKTSFQFRCTRESNNTHMSPQHKLTWSHDCDSNYALKDREA